MAPSHPFKEDCLALPFQHLSTTVSRASWAVTVRLRAVSQYYVNTNRATDIMKRQKSEEKRKKKERKKKKNTC